jgi:hypothetical protein
MLLVIAVAAVASVVVCVICIDFVCSKDGIDSAVVAIAGEGDVTITRDT